MKQMSPKKDDSGKKHEAKESKTKKLQEKKKGKS
jgi:hypothetical protein